MNRRGFLGLFGGATAAGLIVHATPAEVRAFAAPLSHNDPVVLDVPMPQEGTLGQGEHLYNERGELVAIVDKVTVMIPPVEVSTFGATHRQFAPGRPRIRISADGIGSFERTPGGFYLRGPRP